MLQRPGASVLHVDILTLAILNANGQIDAITGCDRFKYERLGGNAQTGWGTVLCSLYVGYAHVHTRSVTRPWANFLVLEELPTGKKKKGGGGGGRKKSRQGTSGFPKQ